MTDAESTARVHVRKVSSSRIVGPEFEAYCATIARWRDASARISAEQLIVPDSKHQPVIHPALVVERQAADDLRKWGTKFRPLTPY